jgi:sugar phosphate isomerase/epimerase
MSVIYGLHGICLSPPFCKVSTPKEAVSITANAGIRNFTIPVNSPIWKLSPETISDDEITNTRKLFGFGVDATCLGWNWPSEYTMVTNSNAEWKRNLNYANKLTDMAEALGINNVILGSAGRGVPADIPYFDGVKLLGKFWREACRYAEKADVVCVIEQSSRARTNVGNTAKDILDLVEAVDSPSFRMLAQIHDMAFNDADLPAAIHALGDIIELVHVADVNCLNPLSDSKTSNMVPGRGIIDFTSIFEALKDVGYDGELCIEALLGDDDPVSDLIECREFMEAKWKQA